MYKAFHPEFTTQRWHVFMAYLVFTWVCCIVVLYMNRALPMFAAIDGVLVIAGVLVTIIVCAVMPHSHGGYATNAFVWREWQNTTGYESNGFVFLLGMLNGAFAVGTPDVVSHLAEEVRQYVFKYPSHWSLAPNRHLLTSLQPEQKYSPSNVLPVCLWLRLSILLPHRHPLHYLRPPKRPRQRLPVSSRLHIPTSYQLCRWHSRPSSLRLPSVRHRNLRLLPHGQPHVLDSGA